MDQLQSCAALHDVHANWSWTQAGLSTQRKNFFISWFTLSANGPLLHKKPIIHYPKNIDTDHISRKQMKYINVHNSHRRNVNFYMVYQKSQNLPITSIYLWITSHKTIMRTLKTITFSAWYRWLLLNSVSQWAITLVIWLLMFVNDDHGVVERLSGTLENEKKMLRNITTKMNQTIRVK